MKPPDMATKLCLFGRHLISLFLSACSVSVKFKPSGVSLSRTLNLWHASQLGTEAPSAAGKLDCQNKALNIRLIHSSLDLVFAVPPWRQKVTSVKKLLSDGEQDISPVIIIYGPETAACMQWLLNSPRGNY